MSNCFQSISDAVSPHILFQLANGSLVEQIPTDSPTVDEFLIFFRQCPLLIFTPYTEVRTIQTQYLEQWVNDQTFIYSYLARMGPIDKLKYELPYFQGQYMIARTLATGGIFAAFKVSGTPDSVQKCPVSRLAKENIIQPNTIPIPDINPYAAPLGTPRFLVGYGITNGKSFDGKDNIMLDVLHEQYWRPSPTSFPLAPGENKRVLLTHMTGLSETSSSEHSFAAALGLNASAGWGPVSASLSASFSDSLTTTHSRTLTQQTLSTTEVHVTNKTDVPQLVVYWELVDSYTIVEKFEIPTTKLIRPPLPLVIRGVVECIAAPSIPRRYPLAVK